MKPKILGIIPARSGSVGVVNKHMKKLGDKPLIQYTIESALQSNSLQTITLSTNCPDIMRFAAGFPQIQIPFQRPEYLATGKTPMLPVVQHTLTFYQEIGQHFDYVCLLQATTPFRCKTLIDKTIMHLLQTNASSLTTVRKVPSKYNPRWCFNMQEEGKLQPVLPGKLITGRQDLPETYYRDGQIYLASTDLVREGFLITPETLGFLNECGPDINIDTMNDWQAAQNWIAHGK